MEDGLLNNQQQVQAEKDIQAKERIAWVRGRLSGSVYQWACGTSDEKDDNDFNLSDRLIGWFVLLVQGLIYAMLLSRHTDSDDIDNEQPAGYTMASATGAMYLLVATTLPDLRAGFSLSVNGKAAGHRVFGISLLIVWGLMVSTGMKALRSSRNDDATVVLTAVTILFVADLDAKALTFLSTVPQKSRLFWVIFSIWISYALGLVAIAYFGDTSDISLSVFPSWFLLAVSPGAVALCSVVVSKALQNFLDSVSEACESVEKVTFGFIVKRGCVGLRGATNRARERLTGGPCFYAVRTLWFADGVVGWWALTFVSGFPVAVDVPPFQFDDGIDEDGLSVTRNLVTFMCATVALVLGLVLKTCGICFRRKDSSAIIPERHHSSDSTDGAGGCGTWAGSRVPSLLVGWGVGYWVTSLLYVLGASWHGGGWTDAPTAVKVAGYVVLPIFFIVGVCMMVDTDLLGERLGALARPAIVTLRDNSGVLYWVMATVLRDVLLLWVLFSFLLLTSLLTDF